MNEQLSQTIVEQIKNRGLKPKPHWQFLLKNQVLWSLTLGASILGGVAVATMIFILTDNDWDVFNHLDRSLFEHIVVSLPYLWLAALVVLIFAARYNFQHTRHGYRYATIKVASLSLLASLILGGLFRTAGFDSELHNLFMEQLPFYQKLTYTKDDIWGYPEKGLLSGRVNQLDDHLGFKLTDYRGQVWNIITTDDTALTNGLYPQTDTRIKIIGRIKQPAVFQAEAIRPWGK